MGLLKDAVRLFTGFSKLNYQDRLKRLVKMGALSAEDIRHLMANQNPSPSLAEHLIENVVGYFHMPLGVAANFNIDGQDYAIPMAVEETSIVAAASKTAKWIRQHGYIETKVTGGDLIGQIQLAHINDINQFQSTILTNKAFLIERANQDVAASMVKRGGGIHDIRVRTLAREDGGHMAVIHVHVNTCDAMGANIINQICEFLKDPIEELTNETVTMCILSNLNDQKITHAKVVMRNIDPIVGYRIQEASLFAENDPYRAATHNKGVLNGMDAMLIATGNDWRAVEAGVHAYAARDGQYRAISTWRMQGDDLVGELSAPIIVGTVGGVTKLHPTAQMCLRMLGAQDANQLARIVAAVGLVQNLGAIRALTTVGIIQGHMKLHIANLMLSAGATEKESPIVQKKLEEILALRKRISLSNAREILREVRAKTKALKDAALNHTETL
ncbi:MAG: 3-hydroxy-3-methylglutaryl coenzyme A reductase [marine bacterium B5-7]|nr:MAG: 3-hydroxy-3-methylglutaryl coenzyme A reductase [marine bacterium B5-7]